MAERFQPNIFERLEQGSRARFAQLEAVREIYTQNDISTLKVRSCERTTIIATVPLLLAILAAACSRGEGEINRPQDSIDDSPKIAFHSDRDGNSEIYVVNPDGTGLTNVTNSPERDDFFPNNPWSPDGSQLVYMSRESGEPEEDKQFDIFVVDRDSKNRRQLTDHPEDDFWPIWSPDGGQIAFISERDGNSEIYVVKPDSSGLKNLTDHPATDGIFTPTWSPDGKRIAFTSNRGGIYDLYSMKADGSDIKLHAKGDLSEHILDLFWSPDGKYIAFEYMITMVGNEIFLVKVEGGGFIQLTKDVNGVAPAWSPDGKFITFNDSPGLFESSDIYVIRPDGTGLVNLTNSYRDDDFLPSWSADGTKIVFTSHRDGNDEIYIMNADGSGLIRLTNHPATDSFPYWTPNK